MRKRHTNMSNEELYHLLKKYREGRCTAEEVERVERWYHQFDEEAEHVPEIPREKLEQLWIAIAARLKEGRRKRLRWWRWGAVASVAALLVAGWLLWRGEERTAETPVAVADAGGMLPAKGVVTLKLNDGRVVALTGDTVFREQNNMAIANDSVRGLDYSDAAVGDTVAVVWNTVETPVGSEYRVVLSDGTRVVLNSCSSLSYPVPFTGDNREVKLAGEAFFEVERDGRPFVVSTGRLDVRVMGTSFDVSDYAEDAAATATLLTGRVEVAARGVADGRVMEPGTTLLFGTDGVREERGRTDLYVSWMEGVFRFENMRLEDIMQKLSRWYDCTVDYADASLREKRFSGAAEKDRPAEYLLGMIEAVTDVEFEVRGNAIRVMYKK